MPNIGEDIVAKSAEDRIEILAIVWRGLMEHPSESGAVLGSRHRFFSNIVDMLDEHVNNPITESAHLVFRQRQRSCIRHAAILTLHRPTSVNWRSMRSRSLSPVVALIRTCSMQPS